MPSSRRAAIKKSTIVRSFALLERVAPAAGAAGPGRSGSPSPTGAAATTGRRPRAARSRSRLHGRKVAGEVWGERPAGGAPTGPTRRPSTWSTAGAGGAGSWTPSSPRWSRPASAWSPSTPPAMATPTPVSKGPAAAPSSSSPTPWPRWRPLTARPRGDRLARGHGGRLRRARRTAAGRLVFVAPMADPLPYTRPSPAASGGERVRTRMVARVERRVGIHVGL